jgi:aryl-alcohol dehydrogenase-like predicted oxidoreductase
MAIADRVRAIAEEKRCTPAQLALAWLLSKPGVIPIPGTTSVKRLEENVRAADLKLSNGDIARIEDGLPKPAGTRYNAAMLGLVNG